MELSIIQKLQLSPPTQSVQMGTIWTFFVCLKYLKFVFKIILENGSFAISDLEPCSLNMLKLKMITQEPGLQIDFGRELITNISS